MCGIAAVTGPGWESAATVRNMLQHLSHRGDRLPEWHRAALGSLGCVRLAIVDEEGGRQPMWNEAGDVSCVFNGEIYNWEPLAAALRDRGHEFRTRCDTEVLVHGYEEWGTDLFARLEGMYAVVIFDDRPPAGRIVAARDPFGIKPLYWGARDDGRSVFGSEIRAVLRAGAREVRPVPAGGRVDNLTGALAPTAAGRPLFPAPLPLRGATVAAAARRVRDLLGEAVRAMIPPEQRVAVLCGGGIDSTAVLYEVALTGVPVVAFVIGTEDAGDVRAVRALIEFFRGVDPKEIATSRARAGAPPAGPVPESFDHVTFRRVPVDEGEVLRSIPRVVEAIESFEPNHIRGGALSYALARAVRAEGIKVALCGEGADELFGGYPEFLSCLRESDPNAAMRDRVLRFTSELHKTQLKRVDRANMAWSVEVRVPFLYGPLAAYAMSLPVCTKVQPGAGDAPAVVKRVLREAYRGELWDAIVDRPKVVLSAGAGMGDNGPAGPFHRLGERSISDPELAALRRAHPEFDLRTKEEALYFSYFCSLFGPLPLAANRPLVNRLPTPE